MSRFGLGGGGGSGGGYSEAQLQAVLQKERKFEEYNRTLRANHD